MNDLELYGDLSFGLLHGLKENFAPVAEEVDLTNVVVRGKIPSELDGAYLRNGPNPVFPPLGYMYPLDGDGMIHGVYFAEGRVRYRNRWVSTRGLRAERTHGRSLYRGVLLAEPVPRELVGDDGDVGPYKNVASTSVVRCGSRILALYELGLPHELDAGLATIGEFDFDGALRSSMIAHPKPDPVTGETHFLSYGTDAPYLVYYVTDANGAITRRVPIDLDYPTMVHDFIVTDRHVVFFDCPARISSGSLAWLPDRGTRIGVLSRAALDAPVRWFQAQSFFTFHFANGFSDDRTITVDYVRRFSVLPGRLGDDGSGRWHAPSMFRMTIDLESGDVRESRLDDRMVEFPRVDDRRSGLAYRFAYAPALCDKEDEFRGYPHLVRYDLATGQSEDRTFGKGRRSGEAIFVPRPGAVSENDGWVMSFVYDSERDQSDFVILNAGDFSGEPAAVIELGVRVPEGNHGNWCPGLRLP